VETTATSPELSEHSFCCPVLLFASVLCRSATRGDPSPLSQRRASISCLVHITFFCHSRRGRPITVPRCHYTKRHAIQRYMRLDGVPCHHWRTWLRHMGLPPESLAPHPNLLGPRTREKVQMGIHPRWDHFTSDLSHRRPHVHGIQLPHGTDVSPKLRERHCHVLGLACHLRDFRICASGRHDRILRLRLSEKSAPRPAAG
jgi:hypothetical protein